MENILNKHFVCDALILTKKDFGEGHISVMCLTKDHGPIRAFAFGGKRISKRFKGSLEYFRIMEMEFTGKQTNGELIFTLSSVKNTKHTYKNISKDINKFITACYIQELASTIINPLERLGKEETHFYDTVVASLEKIDSVSTNDKEALVDIAYNFCINLFYNTGFIPRLKTNTDTAKQLNQMEELHSSILGNSPKSFLMLTEIISNTCQTKDSSERSR